MPSEELLNAKAHLTSLEAFLGSRAYIGFIAARNAEIEELKDSILMFDVIDLKSVFQQCNARGELECLYNMLEVFPKAVDELRDKIADLEDEEQGLQAKPVEMDAVSPDGDR